MKNLTKSTVLFLLSLLFITSCQQSDNQKKLTNENINVIKNSIKRCIDDSIIKIDNYLVNPHFGKFEFDSYLVRIENENSSERNKSAIFEMNDWNDNKFQEIQKEIDDKFTGHSYADLINLSSAKTSSNILTFSGIHENLVFLEIVNYCDKITKDELMKGIDVKNKPKRKMYSIVLNLEHQEVKNLLFDNSASFELQCEND